MIEIRPLLWSDYAACVSIEPWVDVDTLVKHGHAMYDDGVLVGCAGIVPFWPGVGEAWMAPSPNALLKHHYAAVRAARAMFDACDYRRIQADVLPSNGRWMRLFGFTFESEMPGYGPGGEIYHRYVRLR